MCSPIPLLRTDTTFPKDNLVFVVGKLDGLMVVGVRRHNADDIVATALAVEPMKTVRDSRFSHISSLIPSYPGEQDLSYALVRQKL